MGKILPMPPTGTFEIMLSDGPPGASLFGRDGDMCVDTRAFTQECQAAYIYRAGQWRPSKVLPQPIEAILSALGEKLPPD